MSRKIQYLIDWYKKFEGIKLNIQTDSQIFETNLNILSIPHLLGLQYINNRNSKIKGYRLLSYITHKNLSDENIYSLVKQNNPNQLRNVKERVENFKYFMENLENASAVEMTSEITKIKSDYLIIKDKDNKYLQLGIKNIGYEDVFETFLISSDDAYFKNTTICEKVVSIQRYNENFELEAFSFKDSIIEKETSNNIQNKGFTPLNEILYGYTQSSSIDDELIR